MTELETTLAEALRETFDVLLNDVQGIPMPENFTGCDWCDGMDDHESDCDGVRRAAIAQKAGDLLAAYDAAKAKEESCPGVMDVIRLKARFAVNEKEVVVASPNDNLEWEE